MFWTKATVVLVLNFLISSTFQLGKVIHLSNGDVAITGRGCGITTPIRMLSSLPDNPEHFQCAIISKHLKITKNSERLQGGGKCPFPLDAGDGFCDDKANSPACNYDGGDCCGGIVIKGLCIRCQCLERTFYQPFGL